MIEQALAKLSINPRETAAWETLATAVYRPLLAYVGALLLTFRLPPGETAHDITHDVLVAVYQKWPAIKPAILTEADLYKYLRASCRNLLVDRYRSEQRADKLLDFLTTRYARAIETQKEAEEKILTEQLIAALPTEMKCAAIFRLYQQGFTRAEIAEQSGEPPATFYRRWNRCWKKAEEILRSGDKK